MPLGVLGDGVGLEDFGKSGLWEACPGPAHTSQL